MPIIDENMRIPWSALARWGEDAYDREQVSLAAHTFALEHLRLFLFIGYNIFNADSSPLTIGNLGKLLDPKVDRAFREIGIDPNRTDLGHTRYFLRTLEYHERLMCEMILCRLADNYVRYLTELLGIIYKTDPNTLKSDSNTAPVDFVLQFPNREELIYGLADRRTEQLGFKSLQELVKDIEKSIGFNLLGASHRDEAIRVVEERNIIVHNRGKANRIFKGKVPNHPAKLGEQITVCFEVVLCRVCAVWFCNGGHSPRLLQRTHEPASAPFAA